MTTGDRTSVGLLGDEAAIRLPRFDNALAIQLGTFLAERGLVKGLPIAIEIRMGDWTLYKAALPGSAPKNDGWIIRKARVVDLTHHSSLYERVRAEEDGVDWHLKHGVTEDTHAIHGGGLPLIDSDGKYHAALIISGLPQIDDHDFGVESILGFLTQ